MSENIYNKRPSYTDAEIAQLINIKMKENKITKEDLYNQYKYKYNNLDLETIKFMLEGNVFYNEIMLNIASEFLNIHIEELLGILEDENDVSCRGNSDDDMTELYDIVNILFSEMINQIKLSGRNL